MSSVEAVQSLIVPMLLLAGWLVIVLAIGAVRERVQTKRWPSLGGLKGVIVYMLAGLGFTFAFILFVMLVQPPAVVSIGVFLLMFFVYWVIFNPTAHRR
jgi:hypothetical protein